MQNLVGIIRVDSELKQALEELAQLRDRAAKVRVEGNRYFNPGWHMALDLQTMLTVSEANADVTRALNAGVRGYVLKGVGSRTLAEILHNVAGGESYVSPTLSARLLSDLHSLQPANGMSDRMRQLTGREAEILRLVAEGLSNKEGALRLKLQEKTVKHHMTGVLSKLNVRNRTEAALLMREARDRSELHAR